MTRVDDINDIASIHISIITLVITAAFNVAPCTFIIPSTTEALAEAAPSVLYLTPSKILRQDRVENIYAAINGMNITSIAENITIMHKTTVD